MYLALLECPEKWLSVSLTKGSDPDRQVTDTATPSRARALALIKWSYGIGSYSSVIVA